MHTIPNRINYFDNQLFDMYPIVIRLPGDYNRNDVVDAADYIAWRERVGSTNALPNDPIGGIIGASQYTQWRSNFGKTAGSGSRAIANAAVPEPATLLQIVLVA